MATRTRRSGGRRTTIEIEDASLRDLAGDLETLSDKALDRVIRGALDDVALDANERLKRVFEDEIEGGPVDHTKIVPGSKQSSVINNPTAKKTGTDILRSSLKTQKSQSTYLKFALGEEDDREAGDTGAAERFNFIPNTDELRRWQGLSVDRHGNLPRNALSTLSRRSQRPTGTRAAWGSRRDRHGSHEDIFFGRSGRRQTLGFWQRQDDQDHDRSPVPLVLAVPRSEYDDPDLRDGWNRATAEAMDELPGILRRRLAYVLSRMAG